MNINGAHNSLSLFPDKDNDKQPAAGAGGYVAYNFDFSRTYSAAQKNELQHRLEKQNPMVAAGLTAC